jgi:hypothetical protein
MDLFETIMVAMLAGMSNSIIHAIWAILEFIFVHTVNVSIINDDVQVSALNKIAGHGNSFSDHVERKNSIRNSYGHKNIF